MSKAYVQYSKRIATAIFVMWTVYRLAALVLVAVNPDLSTAMTAMQRGVDDVMVVSVGFYTGNSVIEKGIVGYFASKKDEKQDDEAEETEEDESNG